MESVYLTDFIPLHLLKKNLERYHIIILRLSVIYMTQNKSVKE